MRLYNIVLSLLLIALAGAAGCSKASEVTPSPTSDLGAVEAKVKAELTAIAASSTQVPSPTRAPTATATPTMPSWKTFDNPFTYCEAIGTIDKPDFHYTGPATPEAVRRLFPDPWPGVSWRCMNGKVLACGAGANWTCAKEFWDTSREPSPTMVQYCQQNPNVEYMGAVTTGHRTIYEWACRGGVPVIVKQKYALDASGFVSEHWREVQP